MKKFSETAKRVVIKYGHIISAVAFAFVAITSNSSSMLVYYEPEEPIF